MAGPKTLENYPLWIVLISNLVSVAIYFLGAFIIYQTGLIWLALYLCYIILLEIRLVKGHCVNCYYYGKTCAFGKGRISALFFRKGSPGYFLKGNLTWKDMIPDFLVTLIPLITGIVILIKDFDLLILISIISLIFLSSAGNGFVRGSLACKSCKQREISCPAERLFNKKNKK